MGHQATDHNLRLALEGTELLVGSLNAELKASARTDPVLAMVLRDQLELAGRIHQRLCELNAAKAYFGITNSSEENEHGR